MPDWLKLVKGNELGWSDRTFCYKVCVEVDFDDDGKDNSNYFNNGENYYDDMMWWWKR